MAEVLTSWLEETTSMRWGWGGLGGGKDCALWMADYVGRVRRNDPGAAFRGRYSTRLGCEKLLKREGGLVALVARVASAVGLHAAEEPERGHIGVILAPTLRARKVVLTPCAAICVGPGRWGRFSDCGLIVSQAKHINGWIV